MADDNDKGAPQRAPFSFWGNADVGWVELRRDSAEAKPISRVCGKGGAAWVSLCSTHPTRRLCYQAATARYVVAALAPSCACCASKPSLRGPTAASADACRTRAILRASRVSASIRAAASVIRTASAEPRRLSDLPYRHRIAASRCRRSVAQAFRVWTIVSQLPSQRSAATRSK